MIARRCMSRLACSRSVAVVDAEVLDFLEFAQSVAGAFASQAAVFGAAERAEGSETMPRLMPTMPASTSCAMRSASCSRPAKT